TESLGIALVALPKNGTPTEEQSVRGSAACQAVANALRIPLEQCMLRTLDAATGAATVAAADRTIRVQTARDKTVVVATTLGEAP
ncbi:MAG TPA: hypothetical protein VGI99_03560, partial [Gemmataceae bacterium]